MARVQPYSGTLVKYNVIPDGAKFLLGYEYEIDPQSNDNQNEVFDTKILNMDFHWTWESLMAPVHGWEVKSMVTSLSRHRPTTDKFLKVTKFNTQVNGQRTNAGGIHVNIARDDRSNKAAPHVWKYLNDKDNYKHLLKLSQRAVPTFEQYSPQNWNNTFDEMNNEWVKYAILALHKKHCYELRMFAAHPDILIGTLEYADALFTVGHDIGDFDTDTLLHFCLNSPDHTEAARLINAAR